MANGPKATGNQGELHMNTFMTTPALAKPERRGHTAPLSALLICMPLVLLSFDVLAGAHESNQQPQQVPASQVAPMDMRMLEIERQVKNLQIQMQNIRNTANRQERYRQLLQHIRSTRQALDQLRGMEMAMGKDHQAGSAFPDALFKRRQMIIEHLMDMMLIMLEQITLFQEPALK